MKTLFWIIAFILFMLTMAKITHYQERMEEYNAHVCKVNGYEPDCKTLLKLPEAPKQFP